MNTNIQLARKEGLMDDEEAKRLRNTNETPLILFNQCQSITETP